MNLPRAAHTATLLADGRVLIAGGTEGDDILDSAELYDPMTNTFSLTGSMSVVRHNHGAALLDDGNVLVLGGSDERDWLGRYTSAEIFNGANGTFEATSSMSVPRFKLASAIAMLQNGHVLVSGGDALVEAFDPALAEFIPVVDDSALARFFMTATPLVDGRVLIAGGYDLDIQSTDGVWLYTPESRG